MPPNLDLGESQAILLARELEADSLITDDAVARTVAKRHGLRVVGTIGILTGARDRGLIPPALPLVLELRRVGQWIGDALVQVIRAEEEDRSS